MAQLAQSRLKYGRATWIFVLAYVLVTILAVALSVSIGMVGHMPPTPEPMQNQAYLLSERFLPLLNLVVWGIFARVYFRRRVTADPVALRREAISLGMFWLAAAVVVDYVGFVLIKNPISLSPHDFYVGQFPWIYLIYVAIFFAPVCSVALVRRNRLALSGVGGV
ncbi:MAG TPA: hypothetical protein VIX42_06410 [Edaphobacter sp.]